MKETGLGLSAACAMIALLVVTGCGGGDGGSSTAPPAPTPTTTILGGSFSEPSTATNNRAPAAVSYSGSQGFFDVAPPSSAPSSNTYVWIDVDAMSTGEVTNYTFEIKAWTNGVSGVFVPQPGDSISQQNGEFVLKTTNAHALYKSPTNVNLPVFPDMFIEDIDVIATADDGSFGTGYIFLTNALPNMVLIPAGSFTMGNSIPDADIPDAVPVSANVSAFYMDVHEVSLSQWQSVYTWATNVGYSLAAGAGKGPDHPVHTVNWYDVVKWCNARSEQAGLMAVYYTDVGLSQVYTNGPVNAIYPDWAASGYRLPTEAEWEKAARGGLSGQRFPWGNIISQNLANYFGNTAFFYDLGPNGDHPLGGTNDPRTTPVGTFPANGYGLHDMAGNVFEWCWDWYAPSYAGGLDPQGPVGGTFRVWRGGQWRNNVFFCRTAARAYTPPSSSGSGFGFRSVLR